MSGAKKPRAARPEAPLSSQHILKKFSVRQRVEISFEFGRKVAFEREHLPLPRAYVGEKIRKCQP